MAREYGMSPGRSQAQYGHAGHAGKTQQQAHRDQRQGRDTPQQAQHITGGAPPQSKIRTRDDRQITPFIKRKGTSGITGTDRFKRFLSRFNPLKKAPMEYIYPSEHDEYYSGLESGEIPTSNYHRDVTADYWRNVSKNWGDINPALGAMVNLGAPAATMVGGPIYDVALQSGKRYAENPNKYLSSFEQDVRSTQFDPSVTEALGARGVTDISGVDLIGRGRAVAAEQPIKSNLQRMAGSVEPLLSAWGLGNTLNYANGGLVDLYRHGGF